MIGGVYLGTAGVQAIAAGDREPVVGGPCEDCEDAFVAMPAELTAQERIAPPQEEGQPMRIEGRVTHGGKPVAGIIVYAYHTDNRGIYPRDESREEKLRTRHGRLRGWAKTDEQGRYRFDTIRPQGYPDTMNPAHVHMHIIEPGRCTYYIDEIVFTDDPRLTPQELARHERFRGGSGVATPQRDEQGVWIVRRDIVLGEGIPNYPPRES